MRLLPAKRTGRGYFSLRDEMDGLLRSFFNADDSTISGRQPGRLLALDIAEKEDEIVVKADVPGVSADDLDISVHDGVLSIKGERKEEKEEKEENYTLIERSYGAFSRSVALPSYADPDNISAEMANGTLVLTIGKKEEAQPRAIKINMN